VRRDVSRDGWSIDWLPDDRLLVTGQELLRMEPDGSMVRHADLRGAAEHGWNEIVVDGRGNIYVNGIGFGFLAGEPPTPGIIALVTSDGTARKVADDLEFPNGMVITPDNATLIISESMAGRLTALISPAHTLRRDRLPSLVPDGRDRSSERRLLCRRSRGDAWTAALGIDRTEGEAASPAHRRRRGAHRS
jgi:sugar lactone lactonase YvrE